MTATDMATRILDAAETCYQRYGIGKTTLDDVAKAAATSRPTIYRYFKTRDEVTLSVLLRHSRAFAERAPNRLAQYPTFQEKVVEGTVLAVTAAMKDPILSSFYAPQAVSVMNYIVGTAEVLREGACELWGPILEEGIELGEARPDLDVKETCAWLLEVQFILTSRLATGALDVDMIRSRISDFVLPALLSTHSSV